MMQRSCQTTIPRPRPQHHLPYTIGRSRSQHGATGMGITILSDMVYRPWSLEGHRIDLKTLDDDVHTMDVGLAWKSKVRLSPAARAFASSSRLRIRARSGSFRCDADCNRTRPIRPALFQPNIDNFEDENDLSRILPTYVPLQHLAECLVGNCRDGLTNEDRWKDRGAFFQSIAATLNHLYWADALILERLKGNERPEETIKHSLTSPSDWNDFKALRLQRNEESKSGPQDCWMRTWTGCLLVSWGWFHSDREAKTLCVMQPFQPPDTPSGPGPRDADRSGGETRAD